MDKLDRLADIMQHLGPAEREAGAALLRHVVHDLNSPLWALSIELRLLAQATESLVAARESKLTSGVSEAVTSASDNIARAVEALQAYAKGVGAICVQTDAPTPRDRPSADADASDEKARPSCRS